MKRISIAMLAVLMLSLSILTSCGGEDKPPVNTGQLQTDIVTGAEVTTADPRPDLPANDYGGYVFRSLSRGMNSGNLHWFIFDTVPLEERAGDIVNDAVLLRNQYIEETYNIRMKIVENASWQAAARSSILAASDDFDIYGDSIATAAALAAEGLLIDLHTIPYIDLDAKWWDSNANSQLSVMGKLFVTVSDFTLMDKHGTWITLFTKSMIDIYDLDNPYKLVNDGKWTLDKMYEMSQAVSHDANGDGVLGEEDSWGTIGENWNINAFMVGAGQRTFTKNADDIPEFTMNNEKTQNAFEKAYRIMASKDTMLLIQNTSIPDDSIAAFAPIMADNRALFYTTGMNRVLLLRGMDADFGIIPNPKLDESQEKYSTIMTYGNTNSVSVPITNTDLDRTGIILEAITYESSVTSYPAYIETSIKTKYSRDEESIEMLDLIFSTRTFDIGFIYNWGSVYTFYPGRVTSGSADLSSAVASLETSAVAAMEKTLDLFNS